jgi:hypothetical protein
MLPYRSVVGVVTFFCLTYAFAQGCATNAQGRVICAAPTGGAAVDSLGRVVVGPGTCVADRLGRVVCASTPGGGAIADRYGRVNTGPGQCVQNSFGEVYCSAIPGGGAAVDGIGRAVCVGGCVPGQLYKGVGHETDIENYARGVPQR